MDAMTADVTPIRARRPGDDANDTVRRTIRALMAGNGLKVEQLAPMVGMSPSTLYRKFAGQGSAAPFTAGEVAEIADALEVDVAEIYGGLGGRFRTPVSPERSVNNRNHTIPPAAA